MPLLYILLISQKYGQTPISADRNPQKLSITELEFNEAQRLNRPTLLFIMAENHPLTKKDIEPNAAKEWKLNAFRERAKKNGQDSQVTASMRYLTALKISKKSSYRLSPDSVVTRTKKP